jgi:hypothetical protein
MGAPMGSTQAPKPSVLVGYVSLTTTQESAEAGVAERFSPNLLVRFTRTHDDGRVFAMTDQTGTTVVPLQPGEYCAEVFSLDGSPVRETARSLEQAHRCFTVRPATMIEFSLTIAAGEVYSKKLPALAVQ